MAWLTTDYDGDSTHPLGPPLSHVKEGEAEIKSPLSLRDIPP